MKDQDSSARPRAMPTASGLSVPQAVWTRARSTAAMMAVIAATTLMTLHSMMAVAREQTDQASGSGRNARSVGRDALERMHADAEEAYRARRWSDAMQAYNAIVVLEPNHARAWLRIGNLHHRRNQLVSAASAYRKAARRAATEPRGAAAADTQSATQSAWPAANDPFDAFEVRRDGSGDRQPPKKDANNVTRTKALINLALVNVELAQSALAELGEVSAEFVEARDEAAASIGRTRGEVDRRRRRDSPAWRSSRRPASHPPAAEPHSEAGFPSVAEHVPPARAPFTPERDYLDRTVTP